MTEDIALQYPGVTGRIKAMVLDGFIAIGFIFAVTGVLSRLEQVPDSARIISMVFIFLLYEPLFVSMFGGTFGHMLNGLRVKRANNPEKNILFPVAIIRFIVKGLLGCISLLTVLNNDKRQAIHDFAAGSVMVYHKQKVSLN